MLAFFTQIAISLARTGAVSGTQLVLEFILTAALLLHSGGAGVGQQAATGGVVFARGFLIVLLAFARVFFF